MSVLDRSELEQSHLADLHAIAAELGIESYRRLGRDALIDAILAGGGEGGEGGEGSDDEAADEADEKPRGRGRRLRLRRGREGEEEKPDKADGDDGEEVVIPEGDDTESAAPEPRARKKRPRDDASRNGRPDWNRGGARGSMRPSTLRTGAGRPPQVVPAAVQRRCRFHQIPPIDPPGSPRRPAVPPTPGRSSPARRTAPAPISERSTVSSSAQTSPSIESSTLIHMGDGRPHVSKLSPDTRLTHRRQSVRRIFGRAVSRLAID